MTTTPALNVIAITCRKDAADPAAADPAPANHDAADRHATDRHAAVGTHTSMSRIQLTTGLPDDAYEHDGQLTKRDIRAIVLARLAPSPGEVLWDVGAGSGSIGIEWMRAHPRCLTIAIEANASRQQFIQHNRARLGVPSLTLVAGTAPAALAGLPTPNAVFIGGGVTEPGVLEACWAALPAGGRLIANAVTLQSEMRLIEWRARHGGALSRFSVAQAAPLARFDTWRQALPVTLLEAWKTASSAESGEVTG